MSLSHLYQDSTILSNTVSSLFSSSLLICALCISIVCMHSPQKSMICSPSVRLDCQMLVLVCTLWLQDKLALQEFFRDSSSQGFFRQIEGTASLSAMGNGAKKTCFYHAYDLFQSYFLSADSCILVFIHQIFDELSLAQETQTTCANRRSTFIVPVLSSAGCGPWRAACCPRQN